jgi:hypothetical protein
MQNNTGQAPLRKSVFSRAYSTQTIDKTPPGQAHFGFLSKLGSIENYASKPFIL